MAVAESVIRPLIQKLERWVVLSEADRLALMRVTAHIEQFGPHEDLLYEEDIPDAVHLIRQGFACRYKVRCNGKRVIVAFLLPGDFDDLDVSPTGGIDHSVGTLTRGQVVRIPRRAWDDLTDEHPNLNLALRWARLVDGAILREWLVGLGLRSADQRIAHLFCEVLTRLQVVGEATHNSYRFPIKQAALSDATGMSLVHVNRTLQKLRQDGLVVLDGGQVFIPDVEAIKAFAEFDAAYLSLK